MSWGTCYTNGCNNVYTDMPPFVSDGRFNTAYEPSELIDEKIKQSQNIKI